MSKSKRLQIVAPVVTGAPLAPVSLIESISRVIGFTDAGGELIYLTQDQVDQIVKLTTAKQPRPAAGSNPDSVSGLTARYNALVPTAVALGIKGVKHHTSLFGTVAGGKSVLEKLEAEIAHEQAKLADATTQAAASGC